MKDFITEPATKFNFNPSEFVPFKDREVCERVRKMSGKELEKREDWWHPEFNVKVMMNPHPVLIATLFSRLKAASEAGKTFTMILGNPEPETYIPLAQLINYFKVDCSKVHIFAEDEWADDQGNIAPITYEAGFVHSMIKYLYEQIDPKLRMPMENVHFPTNANINDYSKIINGHNPIVAHEYLGNSVEGKDVFIADDIISSGESMLDIAYALKERKARRVFCYATYGLFVNGLEKFDKANEDGYIDAVFSTNLTYRTDELLKREWFHEVDCSKYISYFIASLNHDVSIGNVIDPNAKIKALLDRRNKENA